MNWLVHTQMNEQMKKQEPKINIRKAVDSDLERTTADNDDTKYLDLEKNGTQKWLRKFRSRTINSSITTKTVTDRKEHKKVYS